MLPTLNSDPGPERPQGWGAWGGGHPLKLSLVVGYGSGQGMKAPLRSHPASEPRTCPALVPSIRFKVNSCLVEGLD